VRLLAHPWGCASEKFSNIETRSHYQEFNFGLPSTCGSEEGVIIPFFFRGIGYMLGMCEEINYMLKIKEGMDAKNVFLFYNIIHNLLHK